MNIDRANPAIGENKMAEGPCSQGFRGSFRSFREEGVAEDDVLGIDVLARGGDTA